MNKKSLTEADRLYLEEQNDERRLQSAEETQPNPNVLNVKEVFMSLPPLAEPRRIVAKVDQLMALVDQLEAQLAASRSSAAKLLEALVFSLSMIQIVNTPPGRNIKTQTVNQ